MCCPDVTQRWPIRPIVRPLPVASFLRHSGATGSRNIQAESHRAAGAHWRGLEADSRRGSAAERKEALGTRCSRAFFSISASAWQGIYIFFLLEQRTGSVLTTYILASTGLTTCFLDLEGNHLQRLHVRKRHDFLSSLPSTSNAPACHIELFQLVAACWRL